MMSADMNMPHGVRSRGSSAGTASAGGKEIGRADVGSPPGIGVALTSGAAAGGAAIAGTGAVGGAGCACATGAANNTAKATSITPQTRAGIGRAVFGASAIETVITIAYTFWHLLAAQRSQ
jgi:hypothetical protein